MCADIVLHTSTFRLSFLNVEAMSGADPGVLVDDPKVRTEDDVLFLDYVATFGEKLSKVFLLNAKRSQLIIVMPCLHRYHDGCSHVIVMTMPVLSISWY